MGLKRWILSPSNERQIQALCDQTGYPEVLCAVLTARGCNTKDDVDRAFSREIRLDDPYSLLDMDKAVSRIRQALEQGERIAVYGDYDCDGLTSTVLLTSYLQSVGANVFYYIPDRDKEGYGLNRGAVDTLHKLGANLIVTVDNGISAHDEIVYAASLGMDTVITDHHSPRDTMPDAVAIINPHRADCPSKFKGLAGVGVAFKLICALEDDDGGELLEYYSDIVMLGTVADVVPLTGENRAIVTHGLARLPDTERPGLAALMELSGIAGTLTSSDSVAFGLIPRLNAAGRMGCVDDAVELLLTDDAGYANDLARQIDAQNELRKETESRIAAEIQGIIENDPQILSKRVLIVSGDNWHHGVMGIVAAKISERYGKPSILFSIVGGEARGSGRSIEGYSLVDAITACSEHLTRYGGHTLAAGLTLPADKLDEFASALEAYTQASFPLMPIPPLTIDCALHPRRITPETVASFAMLEPFGAHNPQPLFLLKEVNIEGIYPTSDKKHIRIRFSAGGSSLYAVYFRMGAEMFPYRPGDKVDAIVSLSLGEYNGKTQISVKIKDLRQSGIPQDEILAQRERYARHKAGLYCDGDRQALIPDREHLAAVYRYLRRVGSFGYGCAELYYRLLPTCMGYDRMQVALDVLEEMGLITRTDSGSYINIQIIPSNEKVDIGSSRILAGLR